MTAHVDSQNGVRTFTPDAVGDGTATPLPGVDLATATRADGWVSVPAAEAGIDTGTTVTVENWDYLPETTTGPAARRSVYRRARTEPVSVGDDDRRERRRERVQR